MPLRLPLHFPEHSLLNLMFIKLFQLITDQLKVDYADRDSPGFSNKNLSDSSCHCETPVAVDIYLTDC